MSVAILAQAILAQVFLSEQKAIMTLLVYCMSTFWNFLSFVCLDCFDSALLIEAFTITLGLLVLLARRRESAATKISQGKADARKICLDELIPDRRLQLNFPMHWT